MKIDFGVAAAFIVGLVVASLLLFPLTPAQTNTMAGENIEGLAREISKQVRGNCVPVFYAFVRCVGSLSDHDERDCLPGTGPDRERIQKVRCGPENWTALDIELLPAASPQQKKK